MAQELVKPANIFIRTFRFLGEVRNEMRKVTWPKMEELRKATIVILIFVALIGVLIGLMDTILSAILIRGVALIFGG